MVSDTIYDDGRRGERNEPVFESSVDTFRFVGGTFAVAVVEGILFVEVASSLGIPSFAVEGLAGNL